MYKSFYELNTKPFQISSDPDFMWLGEKHKEALAILKYGVLDNKGFLLLTGDVGTGKTTLINSLIHSLSDDVIYASVSDPSLSKLDFFNYIASSFGIEQAFSTKGAFLIRFRNFLFKAYEENKKVLLIIDEAQLLTQELLEEVRLLSNIEKTNTKLINIFFVGQNEFNEILNQQQNRAVRQRLTLNYNIDPLTPDEINEYIKHRLEVAGTTESIFDLSAVQEIFMCSGGFPRRINVICDHALLSGYVRNDKKISAQIIKECAKELKIPLSVRNRDINGFSNYPQNPTSQAKMPPTVLKPRPREKEKEKKGRGNVMFGTVGFFLFLAVCWWALFPVNFQQFINKTSHSLVEIKTNAAQFFSNSFGSPQTGSTPHQVSKKIDQRDKQADQLPGEKGLNAWNETSHPAQKEQESMHPQIDLPRVPGVKQTGENDKETTQIPLPLAEDDVQRVEKTYEIPKSGVPSTSLSLNRVESKEEKEPAMSQQNTDIKETAMLPEEKIIIRFKYNANDFTEEGFNKIKNFADVLVQHPDTKILIAGYTDAAGNQKYNIKLSEFRANIVKSFLLGRGVNPNQVEIIGLGSKNPIESNSTTWGRTMNRRVEIEVIE